MQKQVFQTDKSTRWKGFKWTMRVIAFLFIFLVAVFVTMMIVDKAPRLPMFRHDYRNVVTASRPFLQETKYSKRYKGFRALISEKKLHTNYAQEKLAALQKYRRFQTGTSQIQQKCIESWDRFPAGIRSAFYVSWDSRSYQSLRRNIHNLNLVIPEWFFINSKTDELKINMDEKGLQLMRKSGVPIMPILSNNENRNFRSESISRILHSTVKSRALIQSLLKMCQQNKFIGINLDLEDLNESSNEYLTNFVKQLCEEFHAHDLLVTQDIMPFNEDYDVKVLSKYLDYLFLMAYDEYSLSSDPGPICSQKWIEAALDNLARKVPNEKIVLGLGAYGYEWCEDKQQNASRTFQEAIFTASQVGSKIQFNDNTYNLSYAFRDYNDLLHQVYFTDAVTHFNAMRFGTEYGLAGFALWRLGSEDNRIWKFYAKNMDSDALQSINKKDLEDIGVVKTINYIGDGEVLDVLNTPHPGKIKIDIDSTNMLISEENYIKIPTAYQVRKYGEAGPRQLLITFDDGPDERWTPQILDILKKYHVHAAFFMVGLQAEKNLPIVKRVYDEGHLIGNHTFTHRNVAKNTPYRTDVELEMTRMLIECITGHTTILFRPPYNADSEPATMEEIIPVIQARRQNYLDVGESIDPEDWEVGIKADEIFRRVVHQVEHGTGHIILFHDAGGDTREETVKVLPRIITYFQKRGYTFTTLPAILGMSENTLMPPISKGKEYYAMQANLALATSVYEVINFLTALFILFIFLGIVRLLCMVIFTIREKRKKKLEYDAALFVDAPQVSIIVPAFNEEVNAVSSLHNLLHQDYPNFNIIFVDDGSKDNTFKRVSDAFSDEPRIRIFSKPNGGKASALSYGIMQTDAEYVVCIDADTKLYPNAVSLMMLHFLRDGSEQVGAVAGNVKVGNQVNMLTKWQAIEYTTSQNFDRMAYANINAITVVPGAIGAFRRKALLEAGGLTTDTLAEDCDLTIRVLRAGYKIENENRAIAMTEAPEKVKQFIKQRTRWSFGVMQTFWKHRDTLLMRKYHGLGLWAMPNMLIFQFIIPVFSPLADFFMIVGLFTGNAERIGIYYLLFMAVDASISVAAYIFERQKLSVLFWIIPQRFCYRWLMYVVIFRSYKRAIKGELQQWGVLKRTGNVADIAEK